MDGCSVLDRALTNVDNALAALAAARHAGVPVAQGIEALRFFKGVARRNQVRGGWTASSSMTISPHHPTRDSNDRSPACRCARQRRAHHYGP